MLDDQISAILHALPKRISDVVEPWAERSPDHPALIETGGAWTYRFYLDVSDPDSDMGVEFKRVGQ
jgi:hypothetical protein